MQKRKRFSSSLQNDNFYDTYNKHIFLLFSKIFPMLKRLLLIFSLFFLAILFESTIFPMPLTLVFICVFSILMGESIAVLAFIAGLVLDLFLLRQIGMDSLIFLLIVYVASRYQRKMSVSNIFYPGFFIAFVSLLYVYMFFQKIDFWQILFSTLLGIVLITVFTRFLPTVVDDRKRLVL